MRSTIEFRSGLPFRVPRGMSNRGAQLPSTLQIQTLCGDTHGILTPRIQTLLVVKVKQTVQEEIGEGKPEGDT